MTSHLTTTEWSTVASAWDAHADHVEAMKAPLTEVLLGRLAARAGDRVLELGAGPGALAARLVGLVGPDGHVLVTDVAAGMVEAARRRTAGVPGVTVDQVDATSTGLPDDSFDAVLFCMGLMFTVDPGATLAEIRRVLAVGGRLAVAVWAGPEHNPWLTSVGMAAMVHGVVGGGPPVAPGEIFSLADPDRLRTLVAEVGFHDAAVEPVALAPSFASTDEHFAHVGSLAPPLAAALAGATPNQRDAVRKTAAELASRYVTDDGVVFPGRALVASGRA